MAECNVATLIDEACESGFKCLDERTFRGVLLQLLCDFQASGGGGGSGNVTKAVIADVALDGSTLAYTVAHGLSATPAVVQARFVCIANDANTQCVVGDEIDTHSWHDATTFQAAFQTFRNATSIILKVGSVPLVGSGGNYTTNRKTAAGTLAPTDWNNFMLRFTAWL